MFNNVMLFLSVFFSRVMNWNRSLFVFLKKSELPNKNNNMLRHADKQLQTKKVSYFFKNRYKYIWKQKVNKEMKTYLLL